MYDEMFFASPIECNDPCEGTFLAIFDKNPNYWERFIEISIGPKIAESNRPLIKKLANYFVGKSPMYVSDFLSVDFEKVADIIGEKNPIPVAYILNQMITKFKIYFPPEHYFVSFSRSKFVDKFEETNKKVQKISEHLRHTKAQIEIVESHLKSERCTTFYKVLEAKYSDKTAAALIANAILRESQAAQLVARSTGNNLERDKTWELMSNFDKDELLHKKIFRNL